MPRTVSKSVLIPGKLVFRAPLERCFGILQIHVQKTQLSCYEVGILRIARLGADINHVETSVDKSACSRQLARTESWGLGCC
jgi:hypothetical protein